MGIDGTVVGQMTLNTYSRNCRKGIELVKGQGYIELNGNKLDSESKDAMSISVWIRLVSNDRVNTIYGSVGNKGLHHLSVKSIGSPNAVIHWLHTSSNGKVIFDITTEPAVPAGQLSLFYLQRTIYSAFKAPGLYSFYVIMMNALFNFVVINSILIPYGILLIALTLSYKIGNIRINWPCKLHFHNPKTTSAIRYNFSI